MSKKNLNPANSGGVPLDGFCSVYECELCADKLECDYYRNTYCAPQVYRDKDMGPAQTSVQQPSVQNNNQSAQSPVQGQAISAGYGYAGANPINQPNPGGQQVQLSPIVIPVSFVPYTTQNQQLYQVETVMPELRFIKRHGLSLFMLALSVSLFFILFLFKTITNNALKEEYSLSNMLSALLGGNLPLGAGGFEEYLKYHGGVSVGAYFCALSALGVFVIAVYNSFKYIIISITGKLKRGPSKANLFLFACVVAFVVGAALLNTDGGRGFLEAFGSVFGANGSFSLSIGFYLLAGVTLLLVLLTVFIKTEEYAPVEGALPEPEEE